MMPFFVLGLSLGLFFLFIVFCFCVFFDHAVLFRRATLYRVPNQDKRIALTFDDGPSPLWTPLILDELNKAQIKATFFMVGHHVAKYPDIARRVADEGHLIGNHGYAHSVLVYYTLAEIEEEIKYTEDVIFKITGQRTRFFRPPKAWLRPAIKAKIHSMGYQVVLWSLNSKDWVAFHCESMARFMEKRVRGGDILLFHDSGNVFGMEGGDRTQTVAAIPLLVKKLRSKGYTFVTLDKL
ncbi:MAG: polysaccharide deacetylase family protein [Candidatus Omnitrophica bacterium]|nr:polysaccharide deacetylase family protein [Candidatus Omnitrophota bacterium]